MPGLAAALREVMADPFGHGKLADPTPTLRTTTQGFRCSLDAEGCRSAAEVARALARSGGETLSALEEAPSFTDLQAGLMLDLLEHEAAHQGQLIRYLYGLRLPIPDGWKARYALS